MAKKALPLRIDEDLLGRVDVRRKELGQTRTMFVERALESALLVPPVDCLGPSPAPSVMAAAAKKTAVALEVRDAVREHRKDEPIAFDPRAAAFERQRKLNEKKGL